MESLVSIITPSYNCQDFISETISSVLSQTYKNWEMIIVDDCSSDQSVQTINTFIQSDSRIKLIFNDINEGAAVSRNKAIDQARGKYIAFLDSDDLWRQDKLEKQIQYMEENDIALSYTSYELINETGKRLNKIIIPSEKLAYKDILKENQIACLTAIYNCHIIGKVHMPLIRKRQDYGLWLSILKKIPSAYRAPGVSALYRVRSNSISSNKINLLKYNFKLFNEYEELSKLNSLKYVVWNIYRRLKK